MSIAVLKNFSYKELRDWFRQQMELNMKQRGWTKSTVDTYYSGAFYVWNKENPEAFWKLVESANFQEDAKAKIMELVQKYCSGEAINNTNGYFRALEVFREFCISNESVLKKASNNRSVKQHINNKKPKLKILIPRPCVSEVEWYLKEWDADERFVEQEKVLNKLFKEQYPENTDIEGVLLKATVLNAFYSTNIYSIYPVAKHIIDQRIDSKLVSGDISVVDDIRKISENDRDNYSFATKYCSHHYPEAFPIYDSYVEKLLCYFRDKDKFSAFKTDELKQYGRFKQILLDFRAYYRLEAYDLKKIDQYLWLLGKKYMPNNKCNKRT